MLDLVKMRIAELRRGTAPEDGWESFRSFVEENIEAIVAQLDTRWLTSICDTYADHGDALSSRNAMLVGTLIKMEKIAQSYVHWSRGYPGSLAVDPATPHRKIRLWDGISSFHLDIGDAPNTMFGRIERMVAETPVIARILAVLKDRLREGDTILGALNRRHGHVFEPDFSWILGEAYAGYRESGRIPPHRYERFEDGPKD